MIRALLLDIEGTTSSLEFVRDVLFPYARQHLAAFIEQHRGSPELEAELEDVARLARAEGVDSENHVAVLQRWIDQDRKAKPLKALQGLLWEDAFRRGAFSAHIYPDVPAALARFRERGLRILIYSSGSVRAQRAFFRHSASGDLTPLIDGYFDTAIGSKSEPAAYLAIARELALPPADIAFLSDSATELDAARSAGLSSIALRREPLTLGAHPAATDFASLPLGLSSRADPPRLEQSELERTKAHVVALSRHCHARGWATATSGNFSVRAGAERMAITASGIDKGNLTERDVLLVGLDLKPLEAGAPSAEAPLHAALYRASPRVGAVVHTHSIAATVLSRRVAGGALSLSGYEMAKALAPVAHGSAPELVLPVFPNDQDAEALARRVSEHLARSPAPAYLIEGHGLTTWGDSAERARHRIEALEFMLACELEMARRG